MINKSLKNLFKKSQINNNNNIVNAQKINKEKLLKDVITLNKGEIG